MIKLMSPEQHSTIETDLKMLEKLHERGDDTGARMIARRLLISHTLSDDEKRRIKTVIDATKSDSVIFSTIIFAVVLFVIIYLYFQYGA